jgi:hypothetical protein
LTQAGIEAEPAMRGAAAVRQAIQSADLELVLVDVDIDGRNPRRDLRPRSSPATGQVPIGILAEQAASKPPQIADTTAASSPSCDRNPTKPSRRSSSDSPALGATSFRQKMGGDGDPGHGLAR